MTATQITYLHLCHRKLWLTGKGIRMENHTNNRFVEEGKLISETTYRRRPQKWKELTLEGIKIDHFDPSSNTVREVKKSPKLEHVHVAQVQYYLYHLVREGVRRPRGIIEYPRQRRIREVDWEESIPREVASWQNAIREITQREECPELVKKPYCRNCAFYDFCFA